MTWTVDSLLQEYVNEKLFESIVKIKIATDRVVPETAELTKDELNALRYVAGFVPFKLKSPPKVPIPTKMNSYCVKTK